MFSRPLMFSFTPSPYSYRRGKRIVAMNATVRLTHRYTLVQAESDEYVETDSLTIGELEGCESCD